MSKYTFRRYLLFVASLFINAFGIAFITKALLGTSPITSVTYVLSLFTPFTMGIWTILLNLLFVVLEPFLMTRRELREDLRMYLLQIPIAFCFGLFIDFSMFMLFWLEPSAYVMKVTVLLVGCVILALGIALEVKANAAMMAGEYFVKTITRRFHGEFGYVKLGFDVTLLTIACILSLVFLSDIQGVREGTVVSALLVGPIVHFVNPAYRIFDRWINAPIKQADTPSAQYTNTIITIAREYGSGGHLLGERLSKELGIKLYDREFIRMAAQRSGIDEQYIAKNEQSIPSFWLKYDNDIWTALKVWSTHPDKVLSTLSMGMINRNIFKVEISTDPFSEERKREIIRQISGQLDILLPEASYFVATPSIEKNMYDPADDSIDILYNDGSTKNIAEASDMLNISLLSKKVKKYYLCYQRLHR